MPPASASGAPAEGSGATGVDTPPAEAHNRLVSPPDGPRRTPSGQLLAAVQSYTANAARELAESAIRDRDGMLVQGVWVKLLREPRGLPASRRLIAGHVVQTIAAPDAWPAVDGTACVPGADGVPVRLLRGEYEVVG